VYIRKKLGFCPLVRRVLTMKIVWTWSTFVFLTQLIYIHFFRCTLQYFQIRPQIFLAHQANFFQISKTTIYSVLSMFFFYFLFFDRYKSCVFMTIMDNTIQRIHLLDFWFGIQTPTSMNVSSDHESHLKY